MERIQRALEQASRERAGAESATGALDTQTEIYKVQYSQTKVVEVSEDVFRKNRIISAVPQHDMKDAYRMLRTRVLQGMRGNNWNSLAVTGPASGCGKTLTAINLAVSLAMEVTSTVVLVDLDLRNPSIHKYFDYEPEYGISDYLYDDVPIEKILFSPSVDRLVVLPGRTGIHNSSEMLRSPKMLSLVDELKNRYPDRYVIVDLPPVLAADDALSFSPYIDAMLLVAEDGSTKTEHLEKALEVLRDAQIIGTVLNKASTSLMGYGYYNAEPSGDLTKA
jgi:capsular exopolysaccharide synthesis family protein